MKPPLNNLFKKERYLCIAWQAVDVFIYKVMVEDDTGQHTVLVRSVIRTRRKFVDTDKEYVNNDPELAEFLLDPLQDYLLDEEPDLTGEDYVIEVETVTEEEVNEDVAPQPNAANVTPPQVSTFGLEPIPEGDEDDEALCDLFGEMDPEDLDALHDQFQMTDDNEYDFELIVDHHFKAQLWMYHFMY